MTTTEIAARVLDKLDESSASSQRYPDARIQALLLDGVRAYVTMTGCNRQSVVVTQEANVLFYDLPCDCIQVDRVGWDSSDGMSPLTPTSTRELDSMTYQWERSTATRATHYFLIGLNRIALWPMATTAGEDYVVYYQQDVYSSLSVMPERDHRIIPNYIVGRYLLSEGKAEEAASELTKYGEGVKAARRRRSNSDRAWAMNGGQGV